MVYSDLLFSVINLNKVLENNLSQVKDAITNGMTETELKAYDFGISTVLSLINSFESGLDINEVLVHTKNSTDTFEQMDYEDLVEFISDKRNIGIEKDIAISRDDLD